MATIEPFGGPFGEGCSGDKRVNLRLCLQIAKLQRSGKGAAGGVEQLGQLQLPCVQVEAAEPVWHYIKRQNAYGKLMLYAEPFSNRAIKVRIGEPQFVRQGFCLRVQIGKMVAPAFNFASRRCNGFRLNLCAARCCASPAVGTARKTVKRPRKRLGRIRACGNPFFDLRPINGEVSKHRIA